MSRILVVEDESAIAELVAINLRHCISVKSVDCR